MIFLSRNEVISTTERAMRSLGLPAGTEKENSKNILWLELHNLGGLDSLVGEITTEQLNYKTSVNELFSESMFDNTSSFLLAQALVDLVTTEGYVSVPLLSSPFILFAEACRRSKIDQQVHMKFFCNGTENFASCNSKCLALHVPCEPTDIFSDVELFLDKKENPERNHNFNHTFFPQTKESIQYPKDLWKIISKEADKTLVPTNISSRLGAGAKTNDSE